MNKSFHYTFYAIILIFTFILCFNPVLSQTEAGVDKYLCKDKKVKIGPDNPDETKYCYAWSPEEGILDDIHSPNPYVSPQKTTVYTLASTEQDFASKEESTVTVYVVDNLPVNPDKCEPNKIEAPPAYSNDNIYGYVKGEDILITISACIDDEKWYPVIENITLLYSKKTRLLEGIEQVTGIGGNTTQDKFCDQVSLAGLTLPYAFTERKRWYMIEAIEAHEAEHERTIKPTLIKATDTIELYIEKEVSIPYNNQSLEEAKEELYNSPDFESKRIESLYHWGKIWDRNEKERKADNMGGPCRMEENKVLLDMLYKICKYARENSWGECKYCPAPSD